MLRDACDSPTNYQAALVGKEDSLRSHGQKDMLYNATQHEPYRLKKGEDIRIV